MFLDRYHAGQVLADQLNEFAHRDDVIVLALPRGGVPVGFEIAKHLQAPLDIFLVRKLGVPGHEELAMGAIASAGIQVLNQDVVEGLGLSKRVIDQVAERELHELERREQAYRDARPQPQLRGKVVILVDDGLATGSTMRAAAKAVRQQAPDKLVVAVPVGARSTCEEFQHEVDDVVCAETPDPFYAVGLYYEDFSQTTDEEVQQLLNEAHREQDAVHRAH